MSSGNVYLMIEVFQECQETSLSHERLCSSLTTLYDKVGAMTPDNFKVQNNPTYRLVS